jgi:hypothetical protein
MRRLLGASVVMIALLAGSCSFYDPTLKPGLTCASGTCPGDQVCIPGWPIATCAPPSCDRNSSTSTDECPFGFSCQETAIDFKYECMANAVCDPFANTGCTAPDTCHVELDRFYPIQVIYCERLGTAAVGSHCSFSSDCIAGAMCDISTCAKICDTTKPGMCPAGKICRALEKLPGNVGKCG